jgi:hypothetical protein
MAQLEKLLPKLFINNSMRYFILIGLLITFTMGCSKKVNNITDQVNTTLESGSWKVVLFSHKGQDKTANYAGYNFSFSGGTVIAVKTGVATASGSWKASYENNFTKLTLNFSIAPLNELNEQWNVTGVGGIVINLSNRNSSGEVSYLSLEKN